MTKKFFLFAAVLMAVAAVTLTACKKDDDEPERETISVVWDEHDLQAINLTEPAQSYTAKGVTLTVIDGKADGTAWKAGDRFGADFLGNKDNEPSFTFTTTQGTGKFCKIVMATSSFLFYGGGWRKEDDIAVWKGYLDKVGVGTTFNNVDQITFYIEKPTLNAPEGN